jgi:hypothetical protein
MSNANSANSSNVNDSYDNWTGYENTTVLAGARNFMVKELEVFSVVVIRQLRLHTDISLFGFLHTSIFPLTTSEPLVI